MTKFVVITVVYNNVPFDDRLSPGWGFSCMIQGVGQTILFDTGGNGPRLIENMTKLGLEPTQIEIVFLSHDHRDHTGGLKDILEENRNVTVYLLSSFSNPVQEISEKASGRLVRVNKPVQVCDFVWSTGAMGEGIREQSLIIETAEGLVIVTGCAHPGIVEVLRRAKEVVDLPICLVMGGFHLAGYGDQEMLGIIQGFKDMGVRKVGPSHCTGDRAIARFRKVWKSDFCELGLGGRIEIAMPRGDDP